MDKIYQIKILLYIIVKTKIKLYNNHKQNEINAKMPIELINFLTIIICSL